MTDRHHLVFVYGTLKRGHGNNHILEGQRMVGPAVTRRRFHVTCVGFPIAYRGGPDPRPLQGELYAVDDWALIRMDRLEGVPRHYQRTSAKVRVGHTTLNAWMYTQSGHGLWRGRPCPVVGGEYVWS